MSPSDKLFLHGIMRDSSDSILQCPDSSDSVLILLTACPDFTKAS